MITKIVDTVSPLFIGSVRPIYHCHFDINCTITVSEKESIMKPEANTPVGNTLIARILNIKSRLLRSGQQVDGHCQYIRL